MTNWNIILHRHGNEFIIFNSAAGKGQIMHFQVIREVYSKFAFLAVQIAFKVIVIGFSSIGSKGCRPK